MRVVRGTYFWQFGSIASLPTETTDGDILVAFFGPNMASEAISECQILKKFSGGACPQTARGESLGTRLQWPYQPEIAGAGPDWIHICDLKTWAGVSK